MFTCTTCGTWFSNLNASGQPECPRCAALNPIKTALGMSRSATEVEVLAAAKRARGFEEIFSMQPVKRAGIDAGKGI